MARTRFIRLAGVGLLVAAAILIVIASVLFVSKTVTNPLRLLQAIVSAALLTGLIALVVAQKNDLGRFGYLGFGIALAGALSALVGSLAFFSGVTSDGFSVLLFFIGVVIPRALQQNSLIALNQIAPGGIWLTSLCLCAGLSLSGLASLRTRRIPRWGAGALLALGLLQVPFVLFDLPIVTREFTVFPKAVYDAVLPVLRISSLPIGLITALLWGILGIALLRYSRT